MRKIILIIFASSLLLTCKNLENADPAPRKTFIKFYEGINSITATAVEKIPTGYVILANSNSVTEKGLQVKTILIETDEQGNRIGDFHFFDNINSKNFKPIINNGVVNNYVIVGDSTSISPSEPQAANVTISSLVVIVLDGSFSKPKRKYLKDNSNKEIKDDFFAGSVSLTTDQDGNLDGAVVLGTFKEGVVNQQNAPEEQLLWGFNASLDSAWLAKYPLLTNTYANARSMHYKNGNLIWATAIADVQGDFISSYLAIPLVQEKSVPVNFSTIGATTIQRFLPQDIKPAASPAFGYGVVGTYSENIDGSKANLFFLRVAANGTIITDSDRYFDGIKSSNSDVAKGSSEIIDSGNAIASTNDGGYFLAGTISTNPLKGNGGKDLLLIKVNPLGDLVWIKTMGGTGDEVPVSVTETDSGDLIVCGTNTLSGYSSVFLMRMDKNGELKN